MGSRNLKQRSFSFGKGLKKKTVSKLSAVKKSMIDIVERIVGRPITARTKKKAAMSITNRPDFVWHITRGSMRPEPITTDVQTVPEIESEPVSFEARVPETFIAEAVEEIAAEPVTEVVREIPVLITIESNEPYYESIEIEQKKPVVDKRVQTTLSDDMFDDEFDAISIHSIAGMAATCSATTTQTTLSSFVMDFDDWDVPEDRSVSTEPVAEELPVAEEKASEPETVDAEKTPEICEYIETPEEKAFFEDLYDDILAHCLYDDVLPAVVPEIFKQDDDSAFINNLCNELAEDSVINDVLPKLVPELLGIEIAVEETHDTPVEDKTEIPVETPAEPEVQIEEEPSVIGSFIDGAAHFSFGYSKSKENAGPTKITFIMGSRDETFEEETCDEEVRVNSNKEPVMASPQTSTRLYL